LVKSGEPRHKALITKLDPLVEQLLVLFLFITYIFPPTHLISDSSAGRLSWIFGNDLLALTILFFYLIADATLRGPSLNAIYIPITALITAGVYLTPTPEWPDRRWVYTYCLAVSLLAQARAYIAAWKSSPKNKAILLSRLSSAMALLSATIGALLIPFDFRWLLGTGVSPWFVGLYLATGAAAIPLLIRDSLRLLKSSPRDLGGPAAKPSLDTRGSGIEDR